MCRLMDQSEEVLADGWLGVCNSAEVDSRSNLQKALLCAKMGASQPNLTDTKASRLSSQSPDTQRTHRDEERENLLVGKYCLI